MTDGFQKYTVINLPLMEKPVLLSSSFSSDGGWMNCWNVISSVSALWILRRIRGIQYKDDEAGILSK